MLTYDASSFVYPIGLGANLFVYLNIFTVKSVMRGHSKKCPNMIGASLFQVYFTENAKFIHLNR